MPPQPYLVTGWKAMLFRWVVRRLRHVCPQCRRTLFASLVDSAAGLFFTAGSILTLCIGPFLWGVTGLKTGNIAKWVSWTGIITGITGLIWIVWLITSPVVLIILLIVLGNIGFFLARRRQAQGVTR